MPNPRPPYPPELRRRLVELVRSGRSPRELSRQFEPTAQAIRNWVKQADLDEGRWEDGLTTAEREELGRLRRAATYDQAMTLKGRTRLDIDLGESRERAGR